MSIKVRLIIMNFLQFFVWGSWLISLGGYMGRELHFEGGQIGAIFATMGIASLVMPGIIGIIADKWFNAERLYGLCHIVGAACLFYASTATGYDQMYWAMLLNLLVYMPTLSLANTVSYNALEQYKCDLIKDFPPIRVWGTIGFICAMWAVDLTGFKNSSAQLYVGAISALLLGVYSFTLPACKPAKTENKSLLSAFGLDALVLFKRKKMAIFFLFSMLLGAALQITNRGETFGYPAIHITDVRDTVYSCYTVFPEAFRHQASDVNQYVCMGIPVRFVRLRRSGRRIVDVDSFHDCLWHGV